MASNKERRQHTRHLRDERVVVQVVSSTRDTLPPGTVVRCSTKDVSRRGLRIQLDQRVPEGFHLELWVEISSQPTKFYLSGEVKGCQEVEEGKRYMVGVELKEDKTEDLEKWEKALEASQAGSLENVREA